MESMIESTKDIIRTTTCTMNGAMKTTYYKGGTNENKQEGKVINTWIYKNNQLK
jgi:hypothetical protein